MQGPFDPKAIEEARKDLGRKFWALSTLLVIGTAAALAAVLTRCGESIREVPVESVSTVVDTQTVTVTATATATATSTQTGTGGGDCPAPFATVQRMLEAKCAGCHEGYATYATARAKAGEFLRRIEIPAGQSGHMPFRGPDLPADELGAFRAWVAGGACEGSTSTPPPPVRFSSWDAVESAAFSDLSRVNENDREETRWLFTIHRTNAGASPDETRSWKEAVVKAINSVSRERRAADVEEIAPGVFRIELDELGWDEKEWERVEQADPLNVESFTAKGLVLKQLTKSRKPIMSAEAFVQAALADAATYYELNEVPSDFLEYMDRKGVKFKNDQKNRKVLMGAFVGSPLSPHNRMVSLFESDDGHCTVTFDTGPTDTPQKNYFAFPLLPDVGGKLNAQFVAGEVICDKKNGLHEYSLWLAKDTVQGTRFIRSDLATRLNAADVGVVIDYRASQKGLSAVISPGISCFACHATGMIPFSDQVRAQVLRNGSEFGTDKDLILAVYREQSQWSGFFAAANESYARALRAIGAAPRGEDPITVVQDETRMAWDLSRLAAFLFVPRDDFAILLNQSANGRAQVGQLLDGGTITFDQVVQTLPQLIQDLRLFQDPL